MSDIASVFKNELASLVKMGVPAKDAAMTMITVGLVEYAKIEANAEAKVMLEKSEKLFMKKMQRKIMPFLQNFAAIFH